MDSELIEYKYDALNRLSIIPNTSDFNNVFICAYEVNTVGGIYPFLKYLMYKTNVHEDIVSFPTFNVSGQSIAFDKLIVMAQKFISIITTTMTTNNNFCLFKGSHVDVNADVVTPDIYLFFDMSLLNFQEGSASTYTLADTNESIASFCIIDEIINTHKVFENKINPIVTNFFLSNIDLIFLTDKNNNKYEIPKACYVSSTNTMVNFTFVFGVSKRIEKNTAILGQYYYFTDYDNCTKNNNDGDGVIRVAVFLGKTLVKLNLPNDPIDESTTKREQLDIKQRHKYERMTMRITDYDGTWSTNYDSVYLGCIELDNGDLLQNSPMIVVKRYDQHVPLSYLFYLK